MVLRLRFIFLCIVSVLLLGSFSVAYGEEVAGLPPAPIVTSDVYHDPEVWYTAEAATFSWELPEEVTAVAVDIATSTDAEPMRVLLPTREFTLSEDDLVEGEQYFAVQFKNANGWGEVAYHKIKIDVTPPTNLGITLSPGDTYPYTSTLFFNAEDSRSGLAGYSLYIGNDAPIFFTPEQANAGYRFSQTEEGTYRVVVVAHDRASNSIANHFPVFVFDVNELVREQDLIFGIATSDGFLMSMLILTTLLAAWIAVHSYLRHRRNERALRREVKEVETEMGKIFAAIRDEIYEQVAHMHTQKRLTKNEKAVVENLSRVLEVSETLVEKELKDVKKLIQ